MAAKRKSTTPRKPRVYTAAATAAPKQTGLKVYIKPGFSKAPAVKKAMNVLNKKLGGQAFTLTTNMKEANVTVRGAKKGSEAMAMGGYAKRIPIGYGAARKGKTKIALNPGGLKYARVTGGGPMPKNVSVAKIAAHEFQHALGVQHKQMVGGKRQGIKPTARTGYKFTAVSKAKAQRVAGLPSNPTKRGSGSQWPGGSVRRYR